MKLGDLQARPIGDDAPSLDRTARQQHDRAGAVIGPFGAIDALRHELGLSVPDDVKVVGFDDIPQSHWKSYNLTTVRIDLEERVRALVRLILMRLRAPDAEPLTETLNTRLIVRGTVG